MSETKQIQKKRLSVLGLAICTAFAAPAMADGLPALGEDSSPWQIDTTY